MTSRMQTPDRGDGVARGERQRTRRRVRWTLAGGSIAASLGLYVALALPASSEEPDTASLVATLNPVATAATVEAATEESATTAPEDPTTEAAATDEATATPATTTVAPTVTTPASRSRAS